MKKKYILEKYDLLFSEIKTYRINNFQLNDELNFVSYDIYRITFIKNKTELAFDIPFNSQHPRATQIVTTHEVNKEDYQDIMKLCKKKFNEVEMINSKLVKDTTENLFYLYMPAKAENLTPALNFFIHVFNQVKNENNLIKSTIKQKVYNCNNKDEIEHYIQKTQYVFENLASRIINEINPTVSNDIYNLSIENNQKDCLKILYIHLEKLLRFIEKEYKSFLNVNIQVPLRTVLIKEAEISPKLRFVKSILLDLEIDEKLLQITYQPILKMVTINVLDKLTYQEFNYCVELIHELHRLFTNNNKEIIQKKLMCWLFELNFNDLSFFQYLAELVKLEINSKDNTIEKINLLYRYLKEVNQKQLAIRNRYNSKIPDIKYQVTTWLEEEIQYLSIKLQHSSLQNNTSVLTSKQTKIHTGFSVAQLAWFINLLVQTKIIKNQNQKEVLRFIATNCHTDNQENISLDSLYSKYYNTEVNTKNVVKDKIIEMLNLSR